MAALTVVAVLWGLLGLSGSAYVLIVARRMRQQTVYQPEFEAWLFHVMLPFAAYATLAATPFGGPLALANDTRNIMPP